MGHPLTKNITFLIIVLCLGLTAPVRAAEDVSSDTMLMFVGEELYTISAASRREESLRKAPAAVTVLGRKELKRYRTLAEALGSTPGFYVDSSGLKEDIYLRGVADSFLVLIDGVPMANDSSNVDYPRGLELSLDYVEKIEIVRGPGSALWGADAFSGVVNIVTQSGKDLEGTRLTGQAGSFDTSGSKFRTGYTFTRGDFLLFGALTQTEGFEREHSGNKRQNDSFRELYGKLTFYDHLTISGRYSNYKDYFTINFLNQHTGIQHAPISFVQASYEDQFWNRVKASFQLYVQEFRNYQRESWRYLIPRFGITFPVETRFTQRNWRYGFDGKLDTEWMNTHLLTLGASLEYNDGASSHNSINGLDVPLSPAYKNNRFALYVQDKYQLADTVEVTAGVRYDKHEDYRRKISPRFSLAWFPRDWLDFKVFYGQAFRTPDLFALTRDPDVHPERIESAETEVALRWGDKFVFQGGYFYNVLEGLLENVSQGDVGQKGSEVEQGTETTVTFTPWKNLCLYANYTYLFGERQRDDPRRVTYEFAIPGIPGAELSFEKVFYVAPNNAIRLGGSYTWRTHYTINLECSYADSRDIDEAFYGVDRNALSPYWITSLNLFAEGLWHDRLAAAIRVRNLFNEGFEYRGENELVRGEGRSVFFELTWKFL